MLDANLTQQLKAYLVNIRQPIELVASLGDDAKSRQMRELIDEIAALSDQITTTTGDDARRPSFLIRRAGTDIGVRFAGLPMGHEFTSLVLALLQVGGHPSKAAQELLDQMRWAEEKTAANERITLYVAFNYGGRAEIIDAARSFDGTTEEEFRALLYAPEMHDPDLIIRTSGEQRLSNFLLWQSAYAELFFSDRLWPEFDEAALDEAIAAFQRRERRFGKTSAQVKTPTSRDRRTA